MHPQRSKLMTVVGYITIATIWILFSDHFLLIQDGHSPQFITLLQTIKGLLFVGITGSLLYLILNREDHRYRDLEARFTDLETLTQSQVHSQQQKLVNLDDTVHDLRNQVCNMSISMRMLQRTTETTETQSSRHLSRMDQQINALVQLSNRLSEQQRALYPDTLNGQMVHDS